jgi:hypothetical protein
MHNKPNRRRQLAIRSFTYGMMTLAVLVGLIICLAYVMGFRFDWQSGQISQVALLQFSSFPTDANIDVNDIRLSSRTPTRLNVKTGQTTVIMSKSGYRQWSKTINALPSEVKWLNYARLIPEKVESESIKSFSAVQQMVTSPNGRWILIQTAADNSQFVLANIADPKKIQFSTLTIDSNLLTAVDDGQSHRLEIVEWDQGSRYILILHAVGETTEFLRLDRQNPANTINLTRDFNIEFRQPHFSGTSGNVFFGLTKTDAADGANWTDLRRFDAGSNLVSAPLASRVDSYRPYGGSRLAIVMTETVETKPCPVCPVDTLCDSCLAETKTVQSVGIYNDGQIKTVKTYDTDEPTIAEFAHYNNQDYLMVARGETVAIYLSPLENESTNQSIYLSSPGGFDLVGFNPSGRFVMAVNHNKIVSYDIETSQNYSFELSENARDINWLDDYHIVDNSGGAISLVEFDGANRQKIVSGYGRASLSADGKYLFSLSSAAGGVVLQRSELVVD